MADDPSPFQIDADWKKQAQLEKERLARKAAEARQANAGAAAPASGSTLGAAGSAASASQAAGQSEMPEASFTTLVSMLASQALLYMGAIPDPQTRQRIAIFDLSRHHIDLLGILEDRTRGNLSDEEARLLGSTLHELRSRYIDAAASSRSTAQATEMASMGPGRGAGSGGASGGGPQIFTG